MTPGIRDKIAKFPRLHCFANSQKRLDRKENQTKYKNMTRKPGDK